MLWVVPPRDESFPLGAFFFNESEQRVREKPGTRISPQNAHGEPRNPEGLAFRGLGVSKFRGLGFRGLEFGEGLQVPRKLRGGCAPIIQKLSHGLGSGGAPEPVSTAGPGTSTELEP